MGPDVKCQSTWTDSYRERLVRLTDDDPPYRVIETVYRCERGPGHGGDHHGGSAESRTNSIAIWPVGEAIG